MTREEQTAQILRNGFQYKGKQPTWFRIHGYNEGEKRGLKVVLGSCTARKATDFMQSVFLTQRGLYPENDLEIAFAGIYDKETMEGDKWKLLEVTP